MRLWNYVATFSNMSGEQLHELYLKLSQDLDGGVGPSHGGNFTSVPPNKGGNPNQLHSSRNQRPTRSLQYASESFHNNENSGSSEAWKRRRRADSDNQYETQPLYQPPPMMTNGNRLQESSSSAGILGWGPAEMRRYGNERPKRGVHPSHFPAGHGPLL